jgi:class 3 adenylate cyclase
LIDKLGEGTGDLTLRIGLHSGPVTAGVLRGEKCRFQLFGDTVNTASRMESTGEKNRIQLSSATAEIIRRAGKGHWLLPREDLVEAKGKGMLQTYWLIYDRSQTATSSAPMSIGDVNVIDDIDEDVDVENSDLKTKRKSVGELFHI